MDATAVACAANKRGGAALKVATPVLLGPAFMLKRW